MYTDHMFREGRNRSWWHQLSGSSFLSGVADLTWKTFQAVNRSLPEGTTPEPSLGSRQNAQEPRTLGSHPRIPQDYRLLVPALRARGPQCHHQRRSRPSPP